MQFKNYLLSEAKGLRIVNVPRFEDEREIEEFIKRLKPGQTTNKDVINTSTGEIFFLAGQDAADIRKRSKRAYKKSEKKYSGIDDDIMMYDGEDFEDHYHVVKRKLEDEVENPQQMLDADYDIYMNVPSKAKRKDGKKLNDNDIENVSKYLKHINSFSHNIEVITFGVTNGKIMNFMTTFK